MSFEKIYHVREKNSSAKVKDINISAICKTLISILVLCTLTLWFCSVLGQRVLFGAAETMTGAADNAARAVVTTPQILAVAFMVLPLALMAVFGAAILKNRKNRLNVSFVIPVIVLGVFCFAMAVAQLAMGNGYQCIAYLVFELFAMTTLMVFNLIENRARINLKGAMRKAGLVGVCIAIMAMSFSSVLGGNRATNKDGTEMEIKHDQK